MAGGGLGTRLHGQLQVRGEHQVVFDAQHDRHLRRLHAEVFKGDLGRRGALHGVLVERGRHLPGDRLGHAVHRQVTGQLELRLATRRQGPAQPSDGLRHERRLRIFARFERVLLDVVIATRLIAPQRREVDGDLGGAGDRLPGGVEHDLTADGRGLADGVVWQGVADQLFVGGVAHLALARVHDEHHAPRRAATRGRATGGRVTRGRATRGRATGGGARSRATGGGATRGRAACRGCGWCGSARAAGSWRGRGRRGATAGGEDEGECQRNQQWQGNQADPGHCASLRLAYPISHRAGLLPDRDKHAGAM